MIAAGFVITKNETLIFHALQLLNSAT